MKNRERIHGNVPRCYNDASKRKKGFDDLWKCEQRKKLYDNVPVKRGGKLRRGKGWGHSNSNITATAKSEDTECKQKASDKIIFFAFTAYNDVSKKKKRKEC